MNNWSQRAKNFIKNIMESTKERLSEKFTDNIQILRPHDLIYKLNILI